jgi:selenocysteine lyase/cysteine desulfurase|tara:strand:+ start:1605 stop:2789 length:1185 start_codon:yes stop_codon:yes gene_type:complete
LSNINYDDFPVSKNYCYLNTHGIGLTPVSVMEDVKNFLDKSINEPPFEVQFENWIKMTNDTRRLFSELINAKEEEISFQANSSTGINIVAEMLQLNNKDNIITDDLNFPSMVWPWRMNKKNNPKIKMVRNEKGIIKPEDYEELIDENTKLITTSSVSFINGFKNDLHNIGKITKKNNIYFLVDACLNTGYGNIDVQKCNIDFLVASNYKWLMSGFGAAEFYCKKKHIDKFETPHAGWFNHKQFPFPKSSTNNPLENRLMEYESPNHARKFEPGNPNYLSVYTLRKCLQYINKIGLERIRNKGYKLMLQLIEEIDSKVEIHSSTKSDHLSLEIFFGIKNNTSKELHSKLRKEGIWAGTAAWDLSKESGVRISTHFYNKEEHIDKTISAIKKIINN